MANILQKMPKGVKLLFASDSANSKISRELGVACLRFFDFKYGRSWRQGWLNVTSDNQVSAPLFATRGANLKMSSSNSVDDFPVVVVSSSKCNFSAFESGLDPPSNTVVLHFSGHGAIDNGEESTRSDSPFRHLFFDEMRQTEERVVVSTGISDISERDIYYRNFMFQKSGSHGLLAEFMKRMTVSGGFPFKRRENDVGNSRSYPFIYHFEHVETCGGEVAIVTNGSGKYAAVLPIISKINLDASQDDDDDPDMDWSLNLDKKTMVPDCPELGKYAQVVRAKLAEKGEIVFSFQCFGIYPDGLTSGIHLVEYTTNGNVIPTRRYIDPACDALPSADTRLIQIGTKVFSTQVLKYSSWNRAIHTILSHCAPRTAMQWKALWKGLIPQDAPVWVSVDMSAFDTPDTTNNTRPSHMNVEYGMQLEQFYDAIQSIPNIVLGGQVQGVRNCSQKYRGLGDVLDILINRGKHYVEQGEKQKDEMKEIESLLGSTSMTGSKPSVKDSGNPIFKDTFPSKKERKAPAPVHKIPSPIDPPVVQSKSARRRAAKQEKKKLAKLTDKEPEQEKGEVQSIDTSNVNVKKVENALLTALASTKKAKKKEEEGESAEQPDIHKNVKQTPPKENHASETVKYDPFAVNRLRPLVNVSPRAHDLTGLSLINLETGERDGISKTQAATEPATKKKAPHNRKKKKPK